MMSEGREARNHEAEIEAALADLVRLKDGPRDDAYRAEKDAAWNRARAALDAVRRSPQGEDHEVIEVHRCGVDWCEMRWIGSKVRCPRGHEKEITSDLFSRCPSPERDTENLAAALYRQDAAVLANQVDRLVEALQRIKLELRGTTAQGGDAECLLDSLLAEFSSTPKKNA